MFRKLLFIVLIFLSVVLAAAFLAKDLLARSLLEGYLQKHIDAHASVGGVHLGRGTVSVDAVTITAPSASLVVDYAQCTVALHGIRPVITAITVRGASCVIPDIVKVRQTFGGGEAASGSKPPAAPLELDLRDIHLTADQQKLSLDAVFSFRGRSGGKGLERIDAFELPSCTVRYGEYSAALHVAHETGTRHRFCIDTVQLKDKKIEGVSLPLDVTPDSVTIERTSLAVLGESAYLTGKIELPSYSAPCVRLTFDEASFSRIIEMFESLKDVTLEGMFTGEFYACFRDSRLSLVSAGLAASSGGMINIKDASSLGFLQKYLDEASFEAVVDNFKNYSYNDGELNVTTKESTVSIAARFASDTLGKRNIEVNLHNILQDGNMAMVPHEPSGIR